MKEIKEEANRLVELYNSVQDGIIYEELSVEGAIIDVSNTIEVLEKIHDNELINHIEVKEGTTFAIGIVYRKYYYYKEVKEELESRLNK